MPKRGLPESVRMRHDEHYVDRLSAPSGSAIGRLLPIEAIEPNPGQPRHAMGDLSELIASIVEKGVIEPLVVRQVGSRYQIIAGERRYQAAVQAGLHELPVVFRDADDSEVIELALIENLQRKDLTPFEEAEAMQGLAQRCSYTHEDLARRLGKSRTAVTETLALTKMPDEVRRVCRLADISSKSLLVEIVRQSDPQKMMALAEQMARRPHVTREAVRRQVASPRPGRPRAFTFNYRPADKNFKLQMSFRKGHVERDEIVAALERILADLRAGGDASREVLPE